MNRVLLSVCLLLAVLAAPCFADTATANGVLAEQRVVNLPNDQGKWYISVVGNANDTAYTRVLDWFEANVSLKGLKNKVHFCPVTAGTPIYQERYAANVKGLPTVRVQKPDGTVVYEASGKNLPMTAEGLYGAIAGAVNTAQGIRPILPWRRDRNGAAPDLDRARRPIRSRTLVHNRTPSRSRLTTAGHPIWTRSRRPKVGRSGAWPCSSTAASWSAWRQATAASWRRSCVA